MCKTTIILLIVGVCNICNAEPTRIVGGEDANITDAPWQVSLQYANSNSHFCGGSIIGDRWILTAGHCMETITDPIGTQVVVGMTKQSEGGVVHKVKQSTRNPAYGSVHIYSHDVTVIELYEKIDFNERAQPVRLPRDEETLPVGEVCNIQGWGRLYQDGPLPDQLQKTTLPLWEPTKCAAAYSYENELFVGDEAPLICAGWDGTYPDTCNGDSGSPLTRNGVQFGLVSFGMGCANPNYPKVFTHVRNMRPFITSVTGIDPNTN